MNAPRCSPWLRRTAVPKLTLAGALLLAAVASVPFGLIGNASAAESGGNAPSAAADPQQSPRKSQAKFLLSAAFAKRFTGSSAKKLAFLRSELFEIVDKKVDLLQIDLNEDTSFLKVEFVESHANDIQPALSYLSEHYETTDPAVRKLAGELEKQRSAYEENLLKMAVIRDAGGIVDPDPESRKAPLGIGDPDSPISKDTLLRYTEAKAEYLNARNNLHTVQLQVAEARLKAAPALEAPPE